MSSLSLQLLLYCISLEATYTSLDLLSVLYPFLPTTFASLDPPLGPLFQWLLTICPGSPQLKHRFFLYYLFFSLEDSTFFPQVVLRSISYGQYSYFLLFNPREKQCPFFLSCLLYYQASILIESQTRLSNLSSFPMIVMLSLILSLRPLQYYTLLLALFQSSLLVYY